MDGVFGRGIAVSQTSSSNQPDEPIEPVVDAGSVELTDSCPPTHVPSEHKHPHGIGHAPPPGHAGDRLTSGRLAGLSMGRAIVVVALPVLCEALLSTLVAAEDAFLATHISDNATDAVGAALYLLWFVGLVAMAIGVGATALVSRSIGAGKRAVANAALGQAILLAVVGGVVLAIVLSVIAPNLADLYRLNPEASKDLVGYLRGYSLGLPFVTLVAAGTACLRGSGDTVKPLLVMAGVNFVNVISGFAFSGVTISRATTLADGTKGQEVILDNPFGMNFGAAGIGMGTATAYAVGAVLIVWMLMRGKTGIKLSARWLKPHRVTMARLVRLGLPNLAETTGMWVVNMAVVLMVSWMSAAQVASRQATSTIDALAAGRAGGGFLGAHVVAIRIEAFSFLTGFAMGIAASTLTGQYLGAGLPHMARRAALTCAIITGAVMGVAGIALMFFGSSLVGVLSPSAVHQELAPKLLFIAGFAQAPLGIGIVLRAAMHGAGDVKAMMKLTWISQWGIRLPLAYAISGVDIPVPQWLGGTAGQVINNPFPFDLGVAGLWIGLCAECALRCFLYGGRFWGGAWMKARV